MNARSEFGLYPPPTVTAIEKALTKGGVEFLPSDAKGEGGCGVQRPDPEGHA